MAFSLRPSWAPVRLTLWLLSRVLGWYFVALPKFIYRWVPHSSAILSIGFLYIFAQALGLMWLLFVNLCSVCSVHIVKLTQRYLAGEVIDIQSAITSILTGYVHYCILRILFFVGASFYTIGWEAFSDFPAVRRLVVGRGSHSSTERSQQQQPGGTVAKPNGSANGTTRGRTVSTPIFPRTPLHETSEEDVGGSPKSSPEHSPEHREEHSEHGSPKSEDNMRPRRRAETEIKLKRNGAAMTPESSGLSVHAENSSTSQGASRALRARKRRRFFREATLLAPLLGLIACSLALATITGVCQVSTLSCDHDGHVFLGSLGHPTGRLNRGIRFAMFVSFLQWVQAFFYLFPTWHRGLLSTGFGKMWSLTATPLWPLALGRLTQWWLIPAGTGITQHVLGLIPHHSLDIAIIIVLKCWMLGACIAVLQRPELSGFDRRRRLIEDDDWREMATLFKYWFLVPTMMHFVRGCFKFGFVGAQNDLLVIVCAYPLLLVTVWTVVWAVVVAPGTQLLLAGAAGSLSLASTICSVAGTQQAVGATIVVWLHLMRQYLKMFKGKADQKARATKLLAAQHGAGSAAEDTDTSPMKSWQVAGQASQMAKHPPERKLGRLVIIASMLIALTFFSVLASLAVAASFQKKIDWYPSTIWFEREEDPPALRVDHTISRLRLRERSLDTSMPDSTMARNDSLGVSYSVCDHSWHGLSVLDYSLLALASYFDSADPSLRQLLDGIFPAPQGLSWQLRNSTRTSCSAGASGSGSRLIWLEVEIHDATKEKPLLVIALRGTDPVRVSDYIEDIRMWTEPVALSILSTVFPTVRAWNRRTVEMVITGIHDFLRSLGMPNDSWSYIELVKEISQIPREQYSQIVLTGHSLGGGMATVVAALTHLPVVGITPPGVYWSLAKHSRLAEEAKVDDGTQGGGAGGDVSRWMHHQSLTLVVEGDWVNGIFDDHGGLVQMMTCDRSHESLELACHMLEGTICHLFNRCGDPLKRWEACEHEYILKDTVKTQATKYLREKLLPPNFEREVENRLAGLQQFWEWVQQRGSVDPGSRIFGNTIALLVIFFIVLPIIGGAIEELLLV